MGVDQTSSASDTIPASPRDATVPTRDIKSRRIRTSGLTDAHLRHVMKCVSAKEMLDILEKID